jgi:hypothetical protein
MLGIGKKKRDGRAVSREGADAHRNRYPLISNSD